MAQSGAKNPTGGDGGLRRQWGGAKATTGKNSQMKNGDYKRGQKGTLSAFEREKSRAQ